MEYLKLSNGKTYTLVTDGLQETGEYARYIFLPEENKTFEEIEEQFSNSENVGTVYMLDSKNDPIRSVVGYTKYKSMEKIKDYVISVEMENKGTEEAPDYQEVQNTGVVMVVTMTKPDIEDRLAELEAKLEALTKGTEETEVTE